MNDVPSFLTERNRRDRLKGIFADRIFATDHFHVLGPAIERQNDTIAPTADDSARRSPKYQNRHIAKAARILENARLDLDREIRRKQSPIAKDVRTGNGQPPRLGELLICLFVRPDRQDERLADFEEYYHNRWRPRFGGRLAGLIYIVNLIWAAIDVARVAAWASTVDALMELWDRWTR